MKLKSKEHFQNGDAPMTTQTKIDEQSTHQSQDISPDVHILLSTINCLERELIAVRSDQALKLAHMRNVIDDLDRANLRLNGELAGAQAKTLEALKELRDGLAPIVNELQNGKINGAWPPTPGDARAVAAEITRLFAPRLVALANAETNQ